MKTGKEIMYGGGRAIEGADTSFSLYHVWFFENCLFFLRLRRASLALGILNTSSLTATARAGHSQPLRHCLAQGAQASLVVLIERLVISRNHL